MSTLRNSLENTNAALVLVLWVVAAASTGIRLAGVLAALSSAAWFDFFLTAPYLTFRINDRADIETTVLLVLVGAAVSETRIGAEGSKRRRVVMRAFWLASSKQRR
jgi:K+-sensing histidine kinase KdpD